MNDIKYIHTESFEDKVNQYIKHWYSNQKDNFIFDSYVIFYETLNHMINVRICYDKERANACAYQFNGLLYKFSQNEAILQKVKTPTCYKTKAKKKRR